MSRHQQKLQAKKMRKQVHKTRLKKLRRAARVGVVPLGKFVPHITPGETIISRELHDKLATELAGKALTAEQMEKARETILEKGTPINGST